MHSEDCAHYGNNPKAIIYNALLKKMGMCSLEKIQIAEGRILSGPGGHSSSTGEKLQGGRFWLNINRLFLIAKVAPK